jgi:heterodisulfide reductase subunit B
MRYTYYPVCSAEATSKAYDISARAVCKKLDVELVELEDWNCCGSTSYFSVRELESFAISARNLAIAEQMGPDDLVAICSACYTILAKTNSYLANSPKLKAEINEALAQAGRWYNGTVRVRHLVDVLVNDVGYEAISNKVERRLSKLKVAPYYGCQLSRPSGTFDDPEFPVTLDRLMEALGAEPVPFPMKAKCCGGMMMFTKEDAAVNLCYELLRCAVDAEADVIVCACPLCEINLEAYQGKVNAAMGTNFRIPVMHFTQLVGFALGCDPKDLALDKQVIPVDAVLAAVPA